MRRRALMGAIAASAAYTTQGRDFDRINDYALRGADLTGIADGKLGLLSCWFRIDGSDGSLLVFLANHTRSSDCGMYLCRNAGGTISLFLKAVGAASVIDFTTGVTYVANAAWRHLIASWDAGNNKAHFFIDGVSRATPAATNANIDYTRTNWSIGAETDAGQRFDGCLSEIWFNTEYLDITIPSNLEKFRSNLGKPVDLGTNGVTPTGNQPLIYMPYGNPADNKGSGGNFTVYGSLDVASTSPSD